MANTPERVNRYLADNPARSGGVTHFPGFSRFLRGSQGWEPAE